MKTIAPGPRGQIFLGHVRAFQRDVLELLTTSVRQFGDVVRFRLGPHVIHLLNHPDHLEHVLLKNQQNYDKGTRSAARIRAVCGDSLLTTDGEFWRRQRRLMQPAFHPQRIAGFASIMTEATATMLQRWRACAERGEPLDVASEMSRLTYTVVGKALFSADVSADAETVEKALAVVLDRTYERVEKMWTFPTWFPSPANRRFQTALRDIDRVVYRIIDERRQLGAAGSDLLSMLLLARDENSEKGMSDEQLRNETLTLLLAGHETTANALSWTFYLLAEHPEVELELRAEVVRVLAGRTPTVQDLSEMKCVTMVVQEALRLYPPIWIFERRALENDEFGGYFIPAGSTVVVSPFVLHRHPAFWARPEAFEPDRFAPPRTDGQPPRAYLPFGAGPHQCIGSHFAMLEARLILAMVAQEYRLQRVPGHAVVPKPGITLRLRHGLRMTLHR